MSLRVSHPCSGSEPCRVHALERLHLAPCRIGGNFSLIESCGPARRIVTGGLHLLVGAGRPLFCRRLLCDAEPYCWFFFPPPPPSLWQRPAAMSENPPWPSWRILVSKRRKDMKVRAAPRVGCVAAFSLPNARYKSMACFIVSCPPPPRMHRVSAAPCTHALSFAPAE